MFSPRLRRRLGRSIFSSVTNLLEFVQQGLVADLQFLRGATPVPARPSQHFQNQFLLCFPRRGPRRGLERNLARVLPVAGARQQGAQSAHGTRLIPNRYNRPRSSFQLVKISRPRVIKEQLLGLCAQRRNRAAENL